MKGFTNKFKIPTILGLGIIIFGIVAAVILTLKEQSFISKASPDLTPQNITVSNISDSEVNLSWQTVQPVASFVTFGIKDVNEQTVLDDRDNNPPAGGPTSHSMHYVTIKNLLPKTTYQYKIFSGKISSETNSFETATPLTTQTGLRPIIGRVLETDNPLDEGIAYLSISDATIQAALIKNSGNFLIPISSIRKSDLSEAFLITEDQILKLTIISEKGQSNILFKLKDAEEGLPPIHLGENLDLTSTTFRTRNFNKFDLNGDGKINAADNAFILQDIEKNPKAKKTDLNSDGIVDQKDLDLMAEQINQ